jgi:hypothetical protein
VGIANEVRTNNIIIVGIAMGHEDLCSMIWVLPKKICKKIPHPQAHLETKDGMISQTYEFLNILL